MAEANNEEFLDDIEKALEEELEAETAEITDEAFRQSFLFKVSYGRKLMDAFKKHHLPTIATELVPV